MIGEDLLRCATAHGEFAIRSHEVRHVARAEQLRTDDRSDGSIGVLKLGHQLVPVFALERALGLANGESSTHADQHIAVTGEGNQLVGWLVDRLTREAAADVRIAAIPPTVGGSACRWFEAVVTLCSSGDNILLLNPNELSPFRDASGGAAMLPPPPVPPVISQASSEPVALVFSTAVLPEAAVDKFALSGRQVAAIVQPTQTISIPGSAPHVAGLTLWRDVVVPIVDYRRDARQQSPHWRRLIARCSSAQSLIAFAIDDNVMMHRPANDDRPVGDIDRPSFVSGVFDVNGDRVALLDVDALLAC